MLPILSAAIHYTLCYTQSCWIMWILYFLLTVYERGFKGGSYALSSTLHFQSLAIFTIFIQSFAIMIKLQSFLNTVFFTA